LASETRAQKLILGKSCRQRFFAALRMTANIVILSAAKGLETPGSVPGFAINLFRNYLAAEYLGIRPREIKKTSPLKI